MNYRKDQIDFYHANVPLALDVEHALGVPHDVTITMLAQLYAESAAKDPKDGLYKPGLSSLYLKANNPLGLRWFEKLHRWNPVTREGDQLPPFHEATGEFVDGHLVVEKDQLFRHFASRRDAMVAYWLLVRKSPRYQPAMRALAQSSVEQPGWQKFALALGPLASKSDTDHCGYSTDPQYGAKICQFVRQFHLDDRQQLQLFVKWQPPDAAAVPNSDSQLPKGA